MCKNWDVEVNMLYKVFALPGFTACGEQCKQGHRYISTAVVVAIPSVREVMRARDRSCGKESREM